MKPTGRTFTSVSAMMRGLKVPKAIQRKVKQLAQQHGLKEDE